MLQKKQFKPSCEVILQLGMQYLLDQFPPPASTGSCSCFLVIVHSWGDTVFAADPDQEDTMVWVMLLTYFLLFCFCFFFNSFTSGLSCGTVYHLREKKKITPGFGGKLAKSWPWARMANLQNHGPEHVWGHWSRILLSLSSAISSVVSCADWFPRPGPGVFSLLHLCVYLYLSIP